MKTIITSPFLAEDFNLTLESSSVEEFEKVLDSILEEVRSRLRYLNHVSQTGKNLNWLNDYPGSN